MHNNMCIPTICTVHGTNYNSSSRHYVFTMLFTLNVSKLTRHLPSEYFVGAQQDVMKREQCLF